MKCGAGKRQREEKDQKKEDADARKGRKVAKHCVFPMIWGSGGSKSSLAKAAGAEPAGQMRDEKLHAVVARSTFGSRNVKNTRGSNHFWKLRCRKSARRCGAKHISKSKCTKHTRSGPLLAVEMSKKCTPLWREAHFQVKMHKTHPLSDHFWQLRCRKSERRCGAKHISKSKCSKHHMFAPLLEVRMLKKCTPLWREAHLEVKMYKTPHVRATFGGSDVEKVHAVVARSTFRSQNAENTPASDHFWRFRCSFAWQAQRIVDHFQPQPPLHYTTRHSNTLHYTTTTTTLSLHSTTLHYTTPHSITLNDTTLHYTTFHYTTSHYTTLHYTTLHYSTLQLHNYTPLHSTTLHRYTKLHYTTLHYTTLHYTGLHCITLHDTTFHYTSLHYTTLHSTTLQLQLQLHSTTLPYARLH